MRRIGLIWCHIALGCQSALAARPVARDEEIPFIRFIGSTAPRYIATSPAVISHPAFSRLRLFCQNPPQGISIVNLPPFTYNRAARIVFPTLLIDRGAYFLANETNFTSAICASDDNFSTGSFPTKLLPAEWWFEGSKPSPRNFSITPAESFAIHTSISTLPS